MASFDNLKVLIGAKLAPVIAGVSEGWIDLIGGVDTGNQILEKGSHTLLTLEERARHFAEMGDFAFKKWRSGAPPLR